MKVPCCDTGEAADEGKGGERETTRLGEENTPHLPREQCRVFEETAGRYEGAWDCLDYRVGGY